MIEHRSAVYLAQISLEDALCFGPRQTLDLRLEDGRPARWTIILGDNGTGKTTLLRAIAGMTPRIADGEPQAEVSPWLVAGQLEWMMWRAPFSANMKAEARFAIGAPLVSTEPSYTESWCEIEITPPGGVSAKVHRTASDYAAVSAMACYGYGAARKIGKAPNLSQDPFELASATLFFDDADLLNVEEWLLQADYAALKAERPEAKEQYRRRLDQIKRTLVGILPDVEGIRIRPPEEASRAGRAIALFKTPYGEVPLGSLGLGYQTMIAWMVDLAARMMRRWPDSENPIEEPAVVLIDEIDLHLHPVWQRQLMAWLSERFINTQFIVTAHSPLVVQAAADAKIVVLRREDDHVLIDQALRAVEGWRVDQLLTSDLFGLPTARPARFDAAIQERKEILSKTTLSPPDHRRLKELDAVTSSLPAGETSEDIAARDIIRRAAEALRRGQGR